MQELNQERFEALDIFRGMTIGLMIVVNTPGSWTETFPPLLHAAWHGFTPTDLVFPSFLFAVGNSLAFSARKWSFQSKGQILSKILRRSLIIFTIGFLLYWFPFFEFGENELAPLPLSETRIFGVLQRIALCYLGGALLVYRLNWKQLIAAAAVLLLTYWGVLHAWGDLTLKGNAARKLDLWLIGPDHMYHGEGIPFDPEGLLSTLPAIVNVIG
ncbi:MAG: heparan-alpha-glucosaminide N-acetyltransferase domain-containing protein, partial [Bacteroidota bacterium]